MAAAAATAPKGSTSKETPKVETAKPLTDFFSEIETEQTNPQAGRCALLLDRLPRVLLSFISSQFQQATYNPFQATGTPGPSTNPFPQFQTQSQPTGFLPPQFTAVPGVAQQSSNPFPTSPNFLQSQMTGANPFRSNTLPMQATGLSPFGQTNPNYPSPTAPNPFSSQNGFLGTNPFPTNSSTNPFPNGGQTNPFPAASSPNPFTGLTNNSVPNGASPNPFPSPNLNPFPTQSQPVSQPFSFASSSQPGSTNFPYSTIQTSALNGNAPGSVPARPASTPLTQRKHSSPPPQPLKPHQTGSRNPFGVPKAPSPPPLPRAPTLFELASGASQPQAQSQSPVQVKPQPTGFQTTTFASVASSFISGTTGGGAQPPQPTTSSFASFGSSSTSPSTPTTTASGSTFSDPLFSSLGGQPTGSTALSSALSSQPTGAPLRPQATGYNAGVKAFKPTSSFGASLLEALPPIPQSVPTTPAFEAAPAAVSSPAGTTGINGVGAPAGVGLGASFSSVSSSPTMGVGTGTSGGGASLGGSTGLSAQPTSSPFTSAGSGGLTALGGGSSIGVGLRPQATGFGVGAGAANPFRASVMTPGGGSAPGAFPPFSTANANAGANLFMQPTGVPSFGQSLFLGAQTDPSKQQNGTASLI